MYVRVCLSEYFLYACLCILYAYLSVQCVYTHSRTLVNTYMRTQTHISSPFLTLVCTFEYKLLRTSPKRSYHLAKVIHPDNEISALSLLSPLFAPLYCVRIALWMYGIVVFVFMRYLGISGCIYSCFGYLDRCVDSVSVDIFTVMRCAL